MSFVKEQGIVLVSARGPVPRLTEAIAGEPVAGSWWAHSKSHEIFRVLQVLSHSPDILVCRLVCGHVTWVHRRLWPALVKVADHFDAERLAQIREEHTASGKHVNHTIAFPEWVPREVFAQAQKLKLQDARALLGASMDLPDSSVQRAAAKKSKSSRTR